MKKQISIALILLLSGCGAFTRSDYQRPLLSQPLHWAQKNARDSAPRVATDRWWSAFNDPRLSGVIDQALTSNNSLADAALTLQLARNAAGLTNTNLTPDIGLSGGASNSKNIRHGTPSQESYNASFTLSYELDFWGKLARARERDAWAATASEQDYLALRLTTIDTAARLYWHIALLRQQISNVAASAEIAGQTLEEIRSWQRAGKVGMLDVLQARQTVLSRQNEVRSLRQQLDADRNALALLLNRPAGQAPDEAQALDPRQQIPLSTTTPLSVIAHRPDIQAAEARLRSALAGYDVSRLSFYPSLTLNGSLGSAGQAFDQWFNQPVRDIGGALVLPFIQWNTTRLTVERASLQLRQAAVAFRGAAYKALTEVDDALERRLSAHEQRDRQQASLDISRERLKLTASRYRAGAVDYQTLLDAQDNTLTLENALAQSQFDYLYATLQLWLAQGAGDEPTRTTVYAAQ